MNTTTQRDPSMWPPGTVTIQDLHPGQDGDVIVLQPPPSEDPNDPLYLNIGLAQFYALVVFSIIDVSTPTWSPMNLELGFSYGLLNDSYAAGSAALCIGALLFIPFALKYGRRVVYIGSLVAQLGIMVWGAKIRTTVDLILFNVFSCGMGALCEVIVQMTVADVFFVHERGTMNNIYIWVANVAGTLGPVASGYVVTGMGWRWVWWWLCIIVAVALVAFVFLYEDSKYVPALTGQTTGQTSGHTSTGQTSASHALSSAPPKDKDETWVDPEKLDHEKIDAANITPIPARKTYWQRISRLSVSPGSLKDFFYHSYQPLLIMAAFPAILYTATLYGITTAGYQITITVVATYMPEAPYNFNASQVGLMSIPGFIGISLSSILSGPMVDGVSMRLARRNNGIFEPEMRLWVVVMFAPFIPAGLIMFGYGLGNGDHWAVPAVGLGIFTFGLGPVTSAALTYITDSYTNIIADGIVGVVFVRNVFATIFIFVVTPWVARVGLGNLFLTFAMINVFFLLTTIVFLVWGKQLRVRMASRYQAFTKHQLDARAEGEGVVGVLG